MSQFPVRRRMGGFTLIEAMTVIAITGILLATGLPELANFSAQRATASAANALASSLRMARAESIKRGIPVTVCPSTNANNLAPRCNGGAGDWAQGWIVLADGGAIGAFNPGDRVVQVQPTWTTVGSITSVSAGGGVGVTFFPTGIAIGGQRDFTFLAKSGGTTETVESLSVRLCTDTTGGTRTMRFDQAC
ncbi:MAG: GspH/FimT family pseudopilin [Burkholderiaceae bacterium]